MKISESIFCSWDRPLKKDEFCVVSWAADDDENSVSARLSKGGHIVKVVYSSYSGCVFRLPSGEEVKCHEHIHYKLVHVPECPMDRG